MCNCKGCCRGGHCGTSIIIKTLLVVGGINWGLVGAGMLAGGENWNVVNLLLSSNPMAESIVYVLVGLAALLSLGRCGCKRCKDGVCNSCAPKDMSNTSAPEAKV